MDRTPSRYTVGIDLGTTNCALAYVDTSLPEDERRVTALEIPQLVAPGEVASLPVLPSFLYLPEAHDEVAETLCLPWHASPPDWVAGAYARDRAAQVPGKVVASAKSWLCNDQVDGRSACLPFDRQAVPRQVSPVYASRCYLAHLRDAWNWRMARQDETLRLEVQDVVLTVPASFDASARELTAEAARDAGLSVRLLEEPQAAFYAWLQATGDAWRDDVADGDVVLVCDVGGGTTDLSLIAITDQDGDLGLQRLAVGEHTLLGGDNMDLTLAYGMAAKLNREQGVQLDGYQLAGLTHACRAAKESLGGEGDGQPVPLTVLGRGSSVIGGTIATEITQEELSALLLDGFFPVCAIDAMPAERRRAGLRTFGLDYASDPGLTKHLAGFVSRHSFKGPDGRPLLPTAVLFNGGVTKSVAFRQRIVDVLHAWQEGTGRSAGVLERHDADLSVALGAAWYAQVQREGGLRIKAGSARSYYIGVESSLPAIPGFAPPVEALCVVPFGLEEGSSLDIDAVGLGLIVGESTEFRFFSSTVRTEDEAGQRLMSWQGDEMEESPPLVAELPLEQGGGSAIGTLVPVRLRAVLTEIGTLELWCEDDRGGGCWKLEFELRNAEQDDG